jgi:hypothetical protein
VALTVGPAVAGVVLRRVARAGAAGGEPSRCCSDQSCLIVAGGPGGAIPSLLGLPVLPAGAWDLVLRWVR